MFCGGREGTTDLVRIDDWRTMIVTMSVDRQPTTEIIQLPAEDQRKVAEALLNPPEPTDALKEAFRLRSEFFGVE